MVYWSYNYVSIVNGHNEFEKRKNGLQGDVETFCVLTTEKNLKKCEFGFCMIRNNYIDPRRCYLPWSLGSSDNSFSNLHFLLFIYIFFFFLLRLNNLALLSSQLNKSIDEKKLVRLTRT